MHDCWTRPPLRITRRADQALGATRRTSATACLKGTSVNDVSVFFRRRLAVRWRLTEVLRGDSSNGPVLNFCRGKAFVSINLQSKKQHVLEIDIDHAYYGKYGRPPSCAR